ncbi:unnamed protein product [Fraxinus pennsylvanica]|uniref:Uncharacterized protein n=1 Tax=Fraxinus pennsylvanica TaxID=56036 RepID=A0AAD2E9G5_9LAMI|nr:unnamed protein product [Fraxinus pennsylvanica]
MERHPLPQAYFGPVGPADWNEALDIISHGSPEQDINGVVEILIFLVQTFQKNRIAYAVKESTLDGLITELLLWLLDERVPRMDDGSQIFRALNVLMLKILVLQNTIYDVHLDRILQNIHIYLQELGMKEIRTRAGANDKPLRMVKTVLHELVKLCGTAIKGHLSAVPIDTQPKPIILAYIDLNLHVLIANS